MTRVAVYGLKDERDLTAFLSGSADGAVFVCGAAEPDLVLPSTAKRLAEALAPCIAPLLYVRRTEVPEIAEAVTAAEIRTAVFPRLAADDAARLRQTLPAHKLLQIFSGNALNEYSGGEYAPFLNGFVLDCSSRENWPVWGIADWMTRSPLPVFFMGSGELLAEAVAEFHPFGALLPCPRLPGGLPDAPLLKETVRRLLEA